MKPYIILYLPITNSEGVRSGVMVRHLEKKPSFLPRIGETVWLTSEVGSTVAFVSYAGRSFEAVRIQLSSISETYRKSLEQYPHLKSDEKWKFDEQIDPEILY